MTPETPAPTVTGERESMLVEAVRIALSMLGSDAGYLPCIGAPATRRLQNALGAYGIQPNYGRVSKDTLRDRS